MRAGRINRSKVVRVTTWLAAIWFFMVVTTVDWFHNHDALPSDQIYVASDCTGRHTHNCSSYFNILEVNLFHSQHKHHHCASCHLLSVLSATGLIHTQLAVAVVSSVCHFPEEPLRILQATVIFITGRSPPHKCPSIA